MGTKFLELKPLLDQKKNCQIKNHLKPRDFSLPGKLANKSHLKKTCNFFCVTVTSIPSKPVASEVYTASPQITQKILITDTCHWLEPVTVILDF